MVSLCAFKLLAAQTMGYFLTSQATPLPKKHSVPAKISEMFLFLLDIRSCYDTYQTFPGTISHEVSLEELML